MNEEKLRTDIGIGVDGCPGGWVAAIYEPAAMTLRFKVVSLLKELTDEFPNAVIGVDVPIGLGHGFPRKADALARELLRYPRAFSVFTPPDKRLLNVRPWNAANAQSRVLTGHGLSRQSFGILPKIEEADALLTSMPQLRARVVEVHPELSFWKMNNNNPMTMAKKKLAGFIERRDLLGTIFPFDSIPESRIEARRRAPGAGADDVLDAIVAAWTALRFARGAAEVVPDCVQHDEAGLPMRIVY